MTQRNGGIAICGAGKEPREAARTQAMPLWQGAGEYEACTAVVLDCVFARLPAQELWRCGGVCRAWRRAACDSSLWRHLLLPNATPHTLRALEAAQSPEEQKGDVWSWRKEYALETARWERCGRLQARGASSVPLLCAALHGNDRYLALVDEDAHVTIWEHLRSKINTSIESEWVVRWNGVVSPEWRGVALAQWAPRSTRLLLAGRLTLVDRYEMIVVHFDEEWCSRIVCRSASGPGGAGCWVDDDAFLSLRLRLLAPGRACTTLWLNAATQEIYSEYAGVTSPLLRIYNEAAAHISHILVAEVPGEEIAYLDAEANDGTDQASSEPRASYYCALRPRKFTEAQNKQRILIAAGGVAGGARGKAQALLMWPLPSLEMPMLWVGDHLAQRVQQHRNRARAPEPQPDEEPDEDALRALCSPPATSCCLHAQVFGIVLHPRGGCVWATTEAGVWCVSLPALKPVLWLPRAVAAPNVAELPPHYLFPCVDDDYFITPAGYGSGRVSLWTIRSGRCSTQLQHDAPALAVFLLKHARSAPGSRRLLVLAADALHIVRSLTSDRETDRARRGSCTPIKVQKCAPCVPKPRPACREPSAACPRGLRLICYPPSAGNRPPCDLPCPPPPLSCESNGNQVQSTKHTEVQSSGEHKNFCGAQLDRVAMRLAAAERLRRLDYEREVAEQTPPPAPVPAPYHLTSEHECLRAIDGRDYTVSKSRINTDKSTRNSKPPCPVKLKPVDKCEISRGHSLDPCEHHPRIFLEIDRSVTNKSPKKLSYNAAKQNDDSNAAGTSSPKQLSTTGRFTTRLLKSLKRNENTVCPRQACKSSSSEKSWCVNLSPPKSVPVNCKEQSLLERLRQKPGSVPGKQCNPQRQLHSQICNEPTPKSNIPGLEEKTKQDKLTSVLRERTHLKEAGRGRVVTAEQKSNKSLNIGSGGLELKVPPNSEAVRVRVSLDFETVDIPTGKKTPAELKNFNGHAISTCHSIVGSDSWLSIKNLQKKFSGYRKNDVSTEIKGHGNHGTCQRPSNKNTSISKKKPECTLPPRSQKPVVHSPHSNTPTLQRPCSQSPRTPYPKQATSQYISQNLLTTY